MPLAQAIGERFFAAMQYGTRQWICGCAL